MRCDRFDRWLDEGMPPADRAAARSHAGGCVRCAAALAAAERVEAMLAQEPAAAPAGFSERVMAMVEAEPAAMLAPRQAARQGPSEAPVPLWMRIAAEPGAAIGLVVAPILLLLVAAWPETARGIIALAHDAIASAIPGAPIEDAMAGIAKAGPWSDAAPESPARLAVGASLLSVAAALAIQITLSWISRRR